MERPLKPISHNIRRTRLHRGISLSSLARAAGISKSTLSELERGNGNPSIDTLWSVARALNVHWSALFADHLRDDVNVIRYDEAPVTAVEKDGFVTRHLLTIHDKREVEVYVLELASGYRRDAQPHSPGVVEHVLVMEGRADVGPEGESAELGPGDWITFSADRAHHYAALNGPARLLALHDYS